MLNVKFVRGWVLIVLAAAAIVPACKNHGGDEEEEKKGEFTLTYDVSGMTGITAPASVKEIAEGAEVTVQALPGASTLPAPYTFYAWNTSAGGGDVLQGGGENRRNGGHDALCYI